MMALGLTKKTFSSEAVYAVLNPKLHKYIKIDDEKKIAVQRSIMKDRSIVNIKREFTDYFLNHIDVLQKQEYYRNVQQIVQYLTSNCKDLDFVFGGGTGQCVTLLNKNLQKRKVLENFSVSDVDLKIKG